MARCPDGSIAQCSWGQDWQIVGTLYEERFAKLQHRDSETSLDPTPNRMLSSQEGRWLSPDRDHGNVSNPQSLNRYAYVMGSPTGLIDPRGLGPCVPGAPGYEDDCPSPPSPGAGVPGYYPGVPKRPMAPPPRDRPAAGGGAPGTTKPVITHASQMGAKQVAIQNALNQLLTNLGCDPDCLKFLGEKGLDPLQTLSDIISNTLYGHADISIGGNPYSIGAVSGGVAGQAITVNDEGAFFLGSPAVGITLTVGPSNIPGGTSQAQAFILLHELGHNTGVLRADTGNPIAGQLNDQDIQNHCTKTIDASK